MQINEWRRLHRNGVNKPLAENILAHQHKSPALGPAWRYLCLYSLLKWLPAFLAASSCSPHNPRVLTAPLGTVADTPQSLPPCGTAVCSGDPSGAALRGVKGCLPLIKFKTHSGLTALVKPRRLGPEGQEEGTWSRPRHGKERAWGRSGSTLTAAKEQVAEASPRKERDSPRSHSAGAKPRPLPPRRPRPPYLA